MPGSFKISYGMSKVSSEKNFKLMAVVDGIKMACQMFGFLKGNNELTDRQRFELNKFVKDNDILNNEMLLKFLQTWDKSITSTNDLTMLNADKFLKWAKEISDAK
jgi:hypothetical protein